MNIYTFTFVKICPNNGMPIGYTLRIEAQSTIMVEDIVAACMAQPAEIFHEDLADAVHRDIGEGVHTLIAYHHGVTIETRRGAR